MSEEKSNKKIFLVSDNDSEWPSIFTDIREQGYRIIRDARSNDQLITRIRTSHPDLIILDEKALNETSFALIRELRDNIETQSTPLYLLVDPNHNPREISRQLDAYNHISILHRDVGRDRLSTLLNSLLKPCITVKFWGVRGSTPCANKENIVYGGNTTCVQIEPPFSDELLILDSGTGIRNLGNYLNEFRENVQGHIFITHPHWDHIQGFPFFKPIYNEQNKFSIHMPPQVTGGCREILSGHLTKTFFPVTLDMFGADLEYITDDGIRKEYENYSIEYMLANHPINTAIYKVDVAGKTIVFAPDNELSPINKKTNAYFYKKLKNFLSDADILIHDAQYDLAGYEDKEEWGHSAWETVVNFAHRAGVKNLFLTHHDPDSDDLYLKQLDEQLQKEHGKDFESVQLAMEGAKIKLELSVSIANEAN